MMPVISPAAAQRAPTDAGAVLRALLQPWREVHLWPPLSWLTPLAPVRLLHADGSESWWLGEKRQAQSAGSAQSVLYTAVELPESQRLECRLQLPPMPASQVRDAVALEVRSASPFEPADLVWGWRAQPGDAGTDGGKSGGASRSVHAVGVLASRRAVERQLSTLASRLDPARPPEVWALDEQGRPIVIQGYGEGERREHASRSRLFAALLLATALAIGAAAAVTPTVQTKLRAMQAQRAYQEAERQMAPLVAQREQLVRTLSELDALRSAMGDHIEPLAVLDQMTQLIPDDTWLQRLQAQGSKITVSGQTPNAAALMNTLSSHPGVRDVRAPAAATRSMAAGRENFTIEWTLAPELLRPSLAATPGGSKP